MQPCIWPSQCCCHSLSLASVKSRLVLPFWHRLTWVVPEKGPLNGCVCVSVCVYISFDLRMRAIVVLGLVFSIPSREVGSGQRLRNDLFCVEWDVKPQLDRWIESACADYSCCGIAGDPVPSDGDLPGQPTGAGPRGVGPPLGHAVRGHAEGFPAGTRLSVRQCR